MWKRDEAVRPAPGAGSGTNPNTGAGSDGEISPAVARSGMETRRPLESGAVTLGKSIVVKGELGGNEDLVIEGQVVRNEGNAYVIRELSRRNKPPPSAHQRRAIRQLTELDVE